MTKILSRWAVASVVCGVSALSHAAVVSGTISGWADSTQTSVIGDGMRSITTEWSWNTTHRGYFYATAGYDVAVATGVTDIGQITNASSYSFTSGNVGPWGDASVNGGTGTFVVWHSLDGLNRYGVLRVDTINSSPSFDLAGTWWYQGDGSGNFSAQVPEPNAAALALLALGLLPLASRRPQATR